MSNETVQILSDAINAAIIQLPGRGFPGIVIQGDSLHTIYSLCKEIVHLNASVNEELSEVALELLSLVQSRMEHYEHVLAQRGIDLPYRK